MVDRGLYEQVSDWMEAHKEEMIRDIRRIVRIESISDPTSPVKPFGPGCRRALDEMLLIGREHGFYTENYEYYVGSIGEKDKDWENLIGFFNHLDVVPLGENWEYPPFDAVHMGDLIIGRGAQDNKGPAVGMLYVMQCVRELNLPVGHELCLFVGCDEERGMTDLEYYGEHYPFPALSIIADCGFPVCYGEKGIIEGKATANTSFSDDVLELYAGGAINMVPDQAVIVLKQSAVSQEKLSQLPEDFTVQEEEDRIRITAPGIGGHSAFPEGSSNAIANLCRGILESGLLRASDQAVVEELLKGSAGNDGEVFGIANEDAVSGKLTCVATMLRLVDGRPALYYNIRYCVTLNGTSITERLVSYWADRGYDWETDRDSAPNYFDPSHPVVPILTDTYNELTGRDLSPYVMGGGTYARKIPNAFGYGIGNMPEKRKPQQDLIRPGHGIAHGPDEYLDCERLLEALKIIVMGLVEIRDVELI